MVSEAYAIDKKNGNTLWHNAFQKEMENYIPDYTQGQEAPQWVLVCQLSSGV